MKDGGQAFPGWAMGSITHDGITHPSGTCIPLSGMTLRQWYKGMALAHLANSAENAISFDLEDIADFCGGVADALLHEDEEAPRDR